MKKLIDLTGQNFNFYTVLERGENKPGRTSSAWKCRCICGTERTIRSDLLRAGKANSCGCRKTSLHRLQRIFDKKYSIKSNGCWEWKGSRDKDGYANLGDKGRKAHRYSYERFKGKIPEEMCVCHTCDNPGCVNPEHLWLGTNKENTLDKVKKERTARGESNGRAKLTENIVVKILLEYREGNTVASIARKYGLSKPSLHKIVKRQAWKHVNFH